MSQFHCRMRQVIYGMAQPTNTGIVGVGSAVGGTKSGGTAGGVGTSGVTSRGSVLKPPRGHPDLGLGK